LRHFLLDTLCRQGRECALLCIHCTNQRRYAHRRGKPLALSMAWLMLVIGLSDRGMLRTSDRRLSESNCNADKRNSYPTMITDIEV
jgi:hypothetical protein